MAAPELVGHLEDPVLAGDVSADIEVRGLDPELEATL